MQMHQVFERVWREYNYNLADWLTRVARSEPTWSPKKGWQGWRLVFLDHLNDDIMHVISACRHRNASTEQSDVTFYRLSPSIIALALQYSCRSVLILMSCINDAQCTASKVDHKTYGKPTTGDSGATTWLYVVWHRPYFPKMWYFNRYGKEKGFIKMFPRGAAYTSTEQIKAMWYAVAI